ncbi:MAG: hypothetical protein AB1861_08495 [Cyanobacteriota bacterium]
MVLILPRTRGIYNGRPTLDHSNPLAKGLVFCTYLGGGRREDLVGGGIGSLFGTAAWDGMMPSGPAFRSPSTTNAGVSWAFPERLLDIKNEITILVRADISAATTNGSRFVVLPFSSTWTTPFQTFSFGRMPSGQGLTRSRLLYTDSATNQVTRDSPSDEANILASDPVTLYGTIRKGSAVSFVRNQKVVSSSTVNLNNVFFGSREPLSVFNIPINNTWGFAGTCDFVAIWSRALTREEIARINHNPYALLRGTPVVFGDAAAPSEGSSGTGSSTLLPPLATGTATAVNRGAALSTLASPLGSGSASIANKGIASSALPNPSALGLATRVKQGIANTILPSPTATSDGKVVATGVASTLIPPPIATGEAQVVAVSQGASSLKPPVSIAAGTVVVQGVASATLSSPVATGEARIVALSQGASSLFPPVSIAAGAVVAQGTGSSVLPVPTNDGWLTTVVTGVGASTLEPPLNIAVQSPAIGTIAVGKSAIPPPVSVAFGARVKIGVASSPLSPPSSQASASACAVGWGLSALAPTATGAARVVRTGYSASVLPAPRTITVGDSLPPSDGNGGADGGSPLFVPKLAPLIPFAGVVATTRLPISYEQAQGVTFVASHTPPERVLVIRARFRDITIAVASKESLVPRSDRTIEITRIMSIDSFPTKEKTPDAVLDYKLDWSQYLAADSDRLLDSEWVLPEGLEMAADKPPSFTSRTTLVWLQGGDINKTYTVINRVVTENGRTDESGFKLKIINYSA